MPTKSLSPTFRLYHWMEAVPTNLTERLLGAANDHRNGLLVSVLAPLSQDGVRLTNALQFVAISEVRCAGA